MATVQYTSFLGEVKAGMERQAAAALEEIGGKAETYAKLLAPTKTSRLKNSITHRMLGSRAVIVGTNVEYAPYVELGHAQQPGRYVPAIGKRLKKAWVNGRPFLKPAVEERTDEYKGILEKHLSQ